MTEDKTIVALIESIARDAETLSNSHPQIHTDYDAGMTYVEIVDAYDVTSLFNLHEKCKKPREVAEAIEAEAIRRYSPDPQKRRRISRARSLANLVTGKPGQFKDLDIDELRKASYAGVEGRGRKILTDAERAEIVYMSKQPEYQTSRGVNAAKIGKEVGRSPGSVRSVIYKAKVKANS